MSCLKIDRDKCCNAIDALKEKFKKRKDNMPINHIDGLIAEVFCLKILNFVFYSKNKIKVSSGYFINEKRKKIILEEEIVRKILKPQKQTWYDIFVVYQEGKIFDVVFSCDQRWDDYYDNYKKIASIYINAKRRIQPIVQKQSLIKKQFYFKVN